MQQKIPEWIWYLRAILFATSLFSVGTRIILNIINGPTPIHTLRYFTLQTNLMVLIWVGLSFRWRNDEEKYSRLTGFTKGAITTYITITWLVFMTLIEPIYDPVGIDMATSIFNHYANPILFIIDLFFGEVKRYEWKWSVSWLIYPISYLMFGVIWGSIFDEWLYFFINLPELGLLSFMRWTLILSGIFFVFGTIYTSINRKLLSEN